MIERENNFSETVLNWYNQHKRDLPWRQNPDPYSVWLSEIILQQTRVSQGMPYYYKFIENYPTVFDLAQANEDNVMKTWEGLGYYSRARNLHATAKTIAYEYNGEFPDSYNKLLKLKGVGPYTAAAIASICFGEPVPVIDGNVYRVISRVFGIENDITIAATRKIFENTLTEVISKRDPGNFNQGLMEIGAIICTPGKPKCPDCYLKEYCYAFKNRRQTELPVKSKKGKVKIREFHYHVWEHNGQLAMKKRIPGDIWQGLYDFYLVEKNNGQDFKEPEGNYITKNTEILQHILSHQKIEAKFYHHIIEDHIFFNEILEKFELSAFSSDEVVTLPKPKLIVNYLNRINF